MSDNAEYRWDWVNNGDIDYSTGFRRELKESYVVRKPDGSILCFTNRYKSGYEEAKRIAEAMNGREGLNEKG